MIYESGEQMDHVYFPTDSIISLLYVMENGATAEIGVTGSEGLVGIALFMGGSTTPNRAVVQSAGGALRMRAKLMQDEFTRGGAFQLALLRYTQALVTQISQSAVCNRFHQVEARLARWLLMTHDRAPSDELQLRQEFLSDMLGMRREGVSVAAGLLQKRKLIRYSRGRITVLDRAGLEAAACECYRIIQNEDATG